MRRLVDEPETALRLALVAPRSELAALMCMHFLSSQPEDRRAGGGGRGGSGEGRSREEQALAQHLAGQRQRLRWHALLTLPHVLPLTSGSGSGSGHGGHGGGSDGHAAVRTFALRLMGSTDDQMDRYGGMKALCMVASAGDAPRLTLLRTRLPI